MSQSAAPSFFTKFAYGFGAIAYGVKNNGFDYFLLMFYSQVVGADPGVVGFALLVALVFDAFSDPVVGYLSDNTHSRFGRRHPWMYFSAVPVAVSYYFLWSPPEGLSGNGLFLYLVGLSVCIRTLITLYEVPSSSLAAEISRDYDQRTSLLAWRNFFGWFSGTAIAAYTMAVLLAPSEAHPEGMFNREGFQTYGLIASTLILISILAASIGTHHLIPGLPKAPPKSSKSLGAILREIFSTLLSRSFIALFMATILWAVATGLSMSLSLYLSSFFWGFTQQQVGQLIIVTLVASFLSLILAPVLSKTLGKKKGAISAGMIGITIAPGLICLRLFHKLPENGEPILFTIVVLAAIIELTLMISVQVLIFSMIADLVEENEVKTKRRSEGVFFAAIAFARKATQGLGVFAASMVLAAASFPEGVTPNNPAEVPEEALRNLGVIYAPTIFTIWVLMIVCLFLYRIDRETHQANLDSIAGDTSDAE